MNTESIRVFCDVIETQSFGQTAEKNYISQSAVSQQVAGLEKFFQCVLIDRRKRPFKLTEEGKIFYTAAQEMLAREEKLISDLNTVRNRNRNIINIGAVLCIGMHILQDYVKKFMAIYPEVHLHIRFLKSHQIYEDVMAGVIDMGIVAVPSRESHLHVFPFRSDQLMLVCHPEHPLAEKALISPADIEDYDCIGLETQAPTRHLIDELMQKNGVGLDYLMEFDNIETIKRAVEINSGISILPDSTIRTELANKTLRAVSFASHQFFRENGIVLRKDKQLTKPARYLLDILSKNA